MKRSRGGVQTWRATLAGLAATLVGIGLARFAYTPLIPALIEAGWYAPADAIYLGAANLAGYLAGALLGRPMAGRAGAPRVLRMTMVLATASFLACAFPLSFLWFFLWRFASGLAGGALMVLAAPIVLAYIPAHRKGLVGGIIFAGVGLGIAASGTLVPLLLRVGLAETWLCLGGIALLLTVAAWHGWPAAGMTAHPARRRERRRSAPALKALYVEYGLNAAGLVPHMVFLVDFVARGLDQGIGVGAHYWVLFGVGAIVGPVLAGHVADRIGFGTTLRLAFVVQAVAIGVLATTDVTVALVVSSIVVGAFVPGIVPVVLGRVRELVPDDAAGQQAGWSFATSAFALGQATAAYGFSFLYDRTGSYDAIFILGAGALALALVIDLYWSRLPSIRCRPTPPPGARRREKGSPYSGTYRG